MTKKIKAQYVDTSGDWFDVVEGEGASVIYQAFELYVHLRMSLELGTHVLADQQTRYIYQFLDKKYADVYNDVAKYRQIPASLVVAILTLMTMMFLGGVMIGQLLV